MISRLYTRVNKRDRLNTLEYLRHVLYGSLLNIRNLVSDIVNKNKEIKSTKREKQAERYRQKERVKC